VARAGIIIIIIIIIIIVIVAGDVHLLQMDPWCGVQILRPASYLAVL